MASPEMFRLFLTIFFIIPFSGGHFDFSELNSIHYGIEIMGTPVIAGENTPPGSVMLTSIYGQSYQCAYPDQQAEVDREKEEEKVAEELGISHLLKPMETSPCLIHSKDWWTYEFCYGKVIKQYHMENGLQSGEILYLGLYESELDWNNETDQVKKNRLNRYHSQQYVNGSVCDLTGKPRRAEVRFQCEDGVGDYIARIDEMATCVYILTVHTTKICHHPYLKPPVTKKPLAITCNPLLSAEEFADYQTVMAEKKARREHFARQAFTYVDFDNPDKIERTIEEQTAKWAAKKKEEQKKKMEEEKEEGNKEEDTNPENNEENMENLEERLEKEEKEFLENGKNLDEEVVSKMADEVQKVLVETLAKELQGHLDKAGDADTEDSSDGQRDPNVKQETVEGSNLRKTFGVDGRPEIDENEGIIKIKLKPLGGGDNAETEADSESDEEFPADERTPETGKPEDQDDVSIETEGDQEALEEFDKGLEVIRRKRRLQRLAKYRETLNSAMQAQFNSIVDEATQELQAEGELEGEVNKPEAFKQLAGTLSKLLSRLERTEEDIHTIEEKIASKVKLASQLRKAAAAAAKKDSEESKTSEQNSGENSEENAPDLPKEAPSEQSETGEKEENEESQQNNEEKSEGKEKKVLLQHGTAVPDDDGRVKVRITRIKQTPDGKKDTEGLSSGSGSQLNLPEEQKQKLENSVQQELQKAGLDAAGGKVEVRIITAGYYNKNEDNVHVLSEEDSSAFNRMIVTILGGSAAEEKESERQQKLKDNYAFTWKKDKKSRNIIAPPQ